MVCLQSTKAFSLRVRKMFLFVSWSTRAESGRDQGLSPKTPEYSLSTSSNVSNICTKSEGSGLNSPRLPRLYNHILSSAPEKDSNFSVFNFTSKKTSLEPVPIPRKQFVYELKCFKYLYEVGRVRPQLSPSPTFDHILSSAPEKDSNFSVFNFTSKKTSLEPVPIVVLSENRPL